MQAVLESYMTTNPNYKFGVPVYMDGMILEASAIHTAYPEYLKESLKNRILSDRSPFESEIFEIVKGERDGVIEQGRLHHWPAGACSTGAPRWSTSRRWRTTPRT